MTSFKLDVFEKHLEKWLCSFSRLTIPQDDIYQKKKLLLGASQFGLRTKMLW